MQREEDHGHDKSDPNERRLGLPRVTHNNEKKDCGLVVLVNNNSNNNNNLHTLLPKREYQETEEILELTD